MEGATIEHICTLAYYVRVCSDLVVELSVLVLVSLDDGAIDELLQLHVVQVGADHRLQNVVQIRVRDEAVVVDVVHAEGD